MAEIQQFDLGRVMQTANTVREGQNQNKLLELMRPYKERAAQAEEQDASLRRNAAAAKLVVSALGDVSQVEPEELQARFSSFRQMAADMGVDVSKVPEQYSPQVYQGLTALASSYGGQGGNVQSTYIDAAGNRVAIMRDGSSRILGKAEGSFQLTDDGAAFNRRDGSVSNPKSIDGQPDGTDGADLLAEKRRERAQADADAAAKKRAAELQAEINMAGGVAGAKAQVAGAEATAKADAERNAARTDKALATQQALSDLSRMRELAEAGVYTGGALDRAGNFLASMGAPIDQARADRTSQIMQLSTQLKFGAKPPGMGAMTDAEWKIVQDAIPDPRAAGNDRQLIAGIQEAERRIIEWRDRQNGGGQQPAPASKPTAPARIRIDAQGNVR
jgi:hypothetical protein